MNSVIVANLLRFLGLLVLQVLIFKRVTLGWDGYNYVQVLLYPVFIMLLPINTTHALGILLSFFLGLGIDIFYGSLGVHASACVMVAFIRPFVLSVLEPKSGYTTNYPVKMRLGVVWFLRYSALLMAVHLFWYFLIDIFTLAYLGEILLKTILSFVFSMAFVVMYQYLLDPSE